MLLWKEARSHIPSSLQDNEPGGSDEAESKAVYKVVPAPGQVVTTTARSAKFPLALPSSPGTSSLSSPRLSHWQAALPNMATNKAASLDEKPNISHLEVLAPTKSVNSDYPVKDVEGEVALDNSGAAKKTDPAEIALVKKLDWYIMPVLWLMY